MFNYLVMVITSNYIIVWFIAFHSILSSDCSLNPATLCWASFAQEARILTTNFKYKEFSTFIPCYMCPLHEFSFNKFCKGTCQNFLSVFSEIKNVSSHSNCNNYYIFSPIIPMLLIFCFNVPSIIP